MANKVGRPRKVFGEEEKERALELAKAQCQVRTIAKVLGCKVERLERDLGTEIIQKRAEGKTEILLSQFEAAKTNTVDRIWFGKQHLEQRDSKDLNVTNTVEQAKLTEKQALEVKRIAKIRLMDTDKKVV